MQKDALHLIIHALDVCKRLSRKTLVSYVVLKLKKNYPKASRTSVGHVVQLLYRAGCFKVEKREHQSSLMELKSEYSKYPELRRQHDHQIINIAFDAGIRMPPEQWFVKKLFSAFRLNFNANCTCCKNLPRSHKLFGDSNHKSDMQSIIDTLQAQQTLRKVTDDMYTKLKSMLEEMDQAMKQNPREPRIISLTRDCMDKIHGMFAMKPKFDLFANLNLNTSNAHVHNKLSESTVDLNNNINESLESGTIVSRCVDLYLRVAIRLYHLLV
jgi:hypothetical protein